MSNPTLNILWETLLKQYPDGVSNTSTTKYDEIRKFLATLLNVPQDEVYITGAKTRTSNLDTRFVQGNQAGRSTKIGVGVIQVGDQEKDVEKLSESAVVTSRKFVDGTDKTQYETILIFVEVNNKLELTRVIEKEGINYSQILNENFPKFGLLKFQTAHTVNVTDSLSMPQDSKIGESIVNDFKKDAFSSGLSFEKKFVLPFISSLLSKRLLILAGLSGSGKTKIAQAFARWITPDHLPVDPFTVGNKFKGAQSEYTVTASNSGIVELTNDDGKVVPLPRAIIEEWADFIEKHSIPESVSGQELREKIEAESKYISLMHRVESHYKPAAFALCRARKLVLKATCYEIIPVGADWTGNENIIGYPDGLQNKNYVTKPTLELIRSASQRKEIPHFLILDEMNLSHVERYFADILSAVESEEALPLYDGAIREVEGREVPRKIFLPENLFIIGTINVDETTYMFSPKVLDRSNVIEFRMESDEMATFLTNPKKPKLESLDGRGAAFGKSFVEASRDMKIGVPESVKPAFESEMILFFNLLRNFNSEFGYRVSYEAAKFLNFYKQLSGVPDDSVDWFNDAMDCIIIQKFLPKLHGSRSKLEGLLWALAWACGAKREEKDGKNFVEQVNEASQAQDEAKYSPEIVLQELKNNSEGTIKKARYQISFEKIIRMWQKLVQKGSAGI